jgi:hypothetical protein
MKVLNFENWSSGELENSTTGIAITHLIRINTFCDQGPIGAKKGKQIGKNCRFFFSNTMETTGSPSLTQFFNNTVF